MSPVDYEEVNNFNNSVQDIKSKYIVLKPQTSSSTATSASATTTTASTFGCNAPATITSSSANTNGKILVNGTSTDKSNNGTGNFDPSLPIELWLLCGALVVVVLSSSFWFHGVVVAWIFFLLIDLASVLCRALNRYTVHCHILCRHIRETRRTVGKKNCVIVLIILSYSTPCDGMWFPLHTDLISAFLRLDQYVYIINYLYMCITNNACVRVYSSIYTAYNYGVHIYVFTSVFIFCSLRFIRATLWHLWDVVKWLVFCV